MTRDSPRTVRLADYAPPPFRIDAVELRFDLGAQETRVESRLQVRRNPASTARPADLELDGEGLALLSARLDGAPLEPARCEQEADRLIVRAVPDAFTLELATRLRPQDNTALEGLYLSAGTYCTQCEAQGFRRITWFPDRPDVMARFTTTIVADRARCPVLLSNGNLVASGTEPDGRHWVRWEDPFPKPSYLFALVAGDLARVEDRFVTSSGREVNLHIYVEHHNADKCEHAMRSLVKAMRWDEEVFGLEYDLDVYMIVAVDDFNMGAMENKGLNVFNSKYVLARPDTATDADFAAIEGVIAHEYFHNWTGNRVTCRDWFQLSLKEGLTVFRDQEFSADAGSRAVKRIDDVRLLRTHQFPEDAGPMAHPVRPDAYIEINNFYTTTVYNKGAEVIRMLHTLLGAEGFRRGMDLYFRRHDGEAVTTDDFVRAMEDANGRDLRQFRLWYSQAGTPRVKATGRHDASAREYALELEQSCPPTPGQPHKEPLHIPLRLGLLGRDGHAVALDPAADTEVIGDDLVELRAPRATLRFRNVDAPPVLSIGRGFSAPVVVDVERAPGELELLIGNDPDPFNRWDASQELAMRVLLRLVEDFRGGREPGGTEGLGDAFAALLRDMRVDRALVAEALTLPGYANVADRMDVIDIDAVHLARRHLRRWLAGRLAGELRVAFDANASNEPYRFEPAAVARRRLRNVCLGYLLELGEPSLRAQCATLAAHGENMTDSLAALAALAEHDCHEREQALEAFHARWRAEPLVLDKWFSIQATSSLPGTLERVQSLMSHPGFSLRNPNRVRALIGAFCHGNPVRFHAADGSGYRFLAAQVREIERLNPQVAARLLGCLGRWRRFDAGRQALMRAELERILALGDLSRDVYEVAAKTLG